MDDPVHLLQHLEASSQLASIWKDFRAIERPDQVGHAHPPDYSPLFAELERLAQRAAQTRAIHSENVHSRDSLLQHIAAEQARLDSRLPQLTVESLCA